jgi:hypothetical protein
MRPIGPIPLSESGGNRVGSNAIVGALGGACRFALFDWLHVRHTQQPMIIMRTLIRD